MCRACFTHDFTLLVTFLLPRGNCNKGFSSQILMVMQDTGVLFCLLYKSSSIVQLFSDNKGAGGQSDQCKSQAWKQRKLWWLSSGFDFTFYLTHQIFNSDSVTLWNHSLQQKLSGCVSMRVCVCVCSCITINRDTSFQNTTSPHNK